MFSLRRSPWLQSKRQGLNRAIARRCQTAIESHSRLITCGVAALWLHDRRKPTSRGHFNKDTVEDQHARAIEKANQKATKKNVKAQVAIPPSATLNTPVIGTSWRCNAFTIVRIAGQRSLTITQRYLHPQADAIGPVVPLVPLTVRNPIREHQEIPIRWAPPLDKTENQRNSEVLEVVGAKGGTRTPMGFPARS
jgi:hypothetical protein